MISTFLAWIFFLEPLAFLKKIPVDVNDHRIVVTIFLEITYLLSLCNFSKFPRVLVVGSGGRCGSSLQIGHPIVPAQSPASDGAVPGCRGCGGRPLFHCVLPARTMDQFQASTSQPPTLASNHTPEPLSTIGNIEPQLTQEGGSAFAFTTLSFVHLVCLGFLTILA